jgi:hypothetical protein
MATFVVGVGATGDVSGTTVTFDVPQHGNGLSDHNNFDYLLNLTRGTTHTITGHTHHATDRNKITTVTTDDATGWVNGDRYALMIGSGTTTYASVATAWAAASATDIIPIYEQNTNGDRHYNEALAYNANITLESNVIGAKNFFGTAATATTINATSAGTIRDLIFIPSGIAITWAIQTSPASGTLTVERCLVLGGDLGIAGTPNAAAFVIVNNCICVAVGGVTEGAFGILTGTGTYNYCATIFAKGAYAFKRFSGTMTCNNCLAYGSVGAIDYVGTIGGKNNASTEASGVPGSNPIHSVTKAGAGFAHYYSPSTTSQYPLDFRVLETATQLVDAGDPVSGVDYDFDGYARDGSTPNVGPSEGWPGLGSASAAAPGKATSVSATAGHARLEMAFTTPANPSGGTTDRVGIAVSSSSAADAASKANAGTFAKIIKGLSASTAYSGRTVAELSGGTNMANGSTYYVVVAPGNSDDVFNTSAVAGDAVSGTPVAGTAPSEPDLSVSSEGDGTVELTVANAGSDTVTFYYRPKTLMGADWVSGGTRSGNGTKSIAGLTNDLDGGYYFQAKRTSGGVDSKWSEPVIGTPTAGAAAADPVYVWVHVFLNGSSTASISKRVNLNDYTDKTLKVYANRFAHRIRIRIDQYDAESAYRIKGLAIKGQPSRQIAR